MKSGIIRRVDDLGRIVIPKEMRRYLRIKEGDPLEISIADNGVLLEKFVPIYEFKRQAKIYLYTFFEQFHLPIVLCDGHEMIASEGLAVAVGSRLSDSLEPHIKEGTEYIRTSDENKVALVEEQAIHVDAVIPIIAGDVIMGSLVLIQQTDGLPVEEHIQCTRFLAKLIASQMEPE